MNHQRWTVDEIKLLNNSKNKTINEIQLLFPNRTLKSIKCKISRLHIELKKDKCVPLKYTAGYGSEKSKISNYKRKYGILLDKKLVINTYDIIQWWKWTYYNTPNNKKLKCLPIELFTDKNLIKLIRYVIEEIIGYKTRESILLLDIKTFEKYKISFHHFFNASLINYINIAFPEYNIKPFELKNVPLGYWQNINNCDEYMKYVLKNDFNVDKMQNIKNELPPLLTFSNLRLLGYGKLTCCITENKHYKSFYEWLNKLYPEWNLTPKDFKEYISYDGEKVDSNEEVIIYNMIKKDMGLNIKAVGIKKSQYKFYNKQYNENYIPDFILEYNNKIIIIEYFGLFRSNYGKSKILKNYYYKTLRKIDFYSDLNDYCFIPIFHAEIKDLNKLKIKINNYLKEAS